MHDLPSTPSAQQAFALAISIERHNRHRFHEWANRFRPYDGEVVRFLEDLAEEERAHEDELLAAYRTLFGDQEIEEALPLALGRYQSGLERVNAHYFIIDAPSAATLLRAALDIERYTREFYTELLARTEDPDEAAVFERLAAFEKEHEREFERRLQAVAAAG
ncbi:MAG: ferritin family protein [Gammaproteobacteria bacterium]|nr:ferritin family protein [Gammaproteobacteria bacterium]